MARLSTTQTVETTVAVELAPELQTQLEANLTTYNELKEQAAFIAEAMDIEKALIREIMEANSIEAMKVGNQPLRIVRGVTSTLDKLKMRADGVTDGQIANWTTSKPKKAYLDIRGAGDE